MQTQENLVRSHADPITSLHQKAPSAAAVGATRVLVSAITSDSQGPSGSPLDATQCRRLGLTQVKESKGWTPPVRLRVSAELPPRQPGAVMVTQG